MTGMQSVSKFSRLALTATLIFTLTPGLALAYVGPGAGISMLGALWGLIAGVVMALGVILFWPIRMMIRKIKANKAKAGDASADKADAAASDNGNTADNSPAS
jgi:hypothetical protein